jgi:hypothetical protein
MSTNERINLVAPCGIDCGTCELYLCNDNQQLLAYLIAKGIPKEKLPCAGCRDIKGNCPVIGSQCASYVCVTEKNVDFCFDCNDFPCSKLNPSADRADVLPHNLKVFNLCTIRRDGVENFIEKSTEIKNKYYKGKMEIGNGPQIAT